jgi:hypothetical protein
LPPGQAQRPAGVGQQSLGVGGGPLGQLGEFAGDPPHRGLRLVAAGGTAQPQLGGDGVRATTGRPAAIAALGTNRAAGGLDPPPVAAIRRTDLANSPESVG